MTQDGDVARDRRLTPARADLAAAYLRGAVTADRFVAPRLMQVRAPVADLLRAPSPEASLDTQLARGALVDVYEIAEGWAWGQARRDGYVGYLSAEALTESVVAPTHHVMARATFLYPAPDIKTPRRAVLARGAQLAGAAHGDFLRLADGFVFQAHCAPLAAHAPDYVAAAEEMIGVPYLWGGATSFGLDCSGLVQTALAHAGRAAPRDADMQARALGAPVAFDAHLDGLRRGDLIFWTGHVGLMRDAQTLLHANGRHMMVASEPLRDAARRIAAAGGGPITAVRRLTDQTISP